MPDITTILLSYVLIYKYIAILVITFLGAIALPLPSGTVVMASVAFATQGYLNLPGVVVVAVLGNVLGDNSGYWIARRYGIEVLEKLGLARFINGEKRLLARKEIDSHPIFIIFFSRFMTGIAPTVNVVCGIAKIEYKKYLPFEFLGECAEVFFFSVLGYVLGTNWEVLTQNSGAAWGVAVSGIILTYLLWRYVLHKNKNHVR